MWHVGPSPCVHLRTRLTTCGPSVLSHISTGHVHPSLLDFWWKWWHTCRYRQNWDSLSIWPSNKWPVQPLSLQPFRFQGSPFNFSNSDATKRSLSGNLLKLRAFTAPCSVKAISAPDLPWCPTYTAGVKADSRPARRPARETATLTKSLSANTTIGLPQRLPVSR